jgi:hypothetical protein
MADAYLSMLISKRNFCLSPTIAKKSFRRSIIGKGAEIRGITLP